MSDEGTQNPGFQCIWKIANFLYCPKSGKRLRSPSFVPESLDQSTWRLVVLPRSGEGLKSIGLFLYRHVGIVHIVTIDFEFEIRLPDGSTLMRMRHPKKVFRSGAIHGMMELVRREDVVTKMKNCSKTLTIICRMWKAEQMPLEFKKCSISTSVGTNARSFDWKIRNFSAVQPNDKEFCPVIYKLNLPLSIMLFYINVYLDDLKLHVFGENNAMPFAAGCKVSVISNEQPIPLLSECFHVFDEDKDSPWVLPNFMNRSVLFENSSLYLPNDVLTLRFEFTVSNGSVSHNVRYEPLPTNTATRQKKEITSPLLQQNILQLFIDPIFSDIQLGTKSRETFKCHKSILGSRSSVLKTRIEDMGNATTLEIDDCDGDILKRMLLYLYTDTIETLTIESALKLYGVACIYCLQGLKDECSKFLAKNLGLGNVPDVLVLAHSNKDGDLKSSARDFILKHEKEVIKSEYWKEIYKINLELAAETLEWLCLQNDRKTKK